MKNYYYNVTQENKRTGCENGNGTKFTNMKKAIEEGKRQFEWLTDYEKKEYRINVNKNVITEYDEDGEEISGYGIIIKSFEK